MKTQCEQTNSRFAESLTDILFEKRLSPRDFAAQIGVSLATVYAWKKGRQDIKLSHLNAIANLFGCSIDFLIVKSDDATPVSPSVLPNFGSALRRAMGNSGATTYTLRQMGYGSKHFENWDNGADPFLSTLLDLSAALDCSVDGLVGRSL